MGGTDKVLDYSSGSGTTALVFTGYTVASGDADTDGLSIDANQLTLNSGTIKASGGGGPDAVLTHAAVAASASHKVDGVKPTLVITGADAPKTSTDGTKVILTFSENITLTFGTAFVAAYTVTIGGTAATVDSVEVTPGNLARIELMLASTNTVAAGDTVTVALDSDAVLDGAGNGNDALAATAVINAVTAAPTVDSIAFNSAGMDGAFKTGDAVTATVTFSEAVTVDTTGGTPHLTIDVGGADTGLNYASGTGTTALVFSGYRVAPNHEDTDGISIAANKLDANDGTIKATADATLDAVLNHAAVADSASHKVDGVKPTLVTPAAMREDLHRRHENHPHLQRGHRLGRLHEHHRAVGHDVPGHQRRFEERVHGRNHPDDGPGFHGHEHHRGAQCRRRHRRARQRQRRGGRDDRHPCERSRAPPS